MSRHFEHAHDVLMNELAGGALPSQNFGANAAWLRLNVILYNLLSADKRVGRSEELHTARPKRLRLLLLDTSARSSATPARPYCAAPRGSHEPSPARRQPDSPSTAPS
jgi:hypothetical protein